MNLPLCTENSSSEDYFEIEIIKWLGGFEPVTENTSNRGSRIFLTRVKILPGINEYRHTQNNTYAIGIGKKDVDHHAVEREIKYYIKNITQDNVKLYSSYLKRRVHVEIESFAYLSDSLERHNICTLTTRDSNYALRYGYLSDNKHHLTSVLPACDKCLKKMVAGIMENSIKYKNCLWRDFQKQQII